MMRGALFLGSLERAIKARSGSMILDNFNLLLQMDPWKHGFSNGSFSAAVLSATIVITLVTHAWLLIGFTL